MTEVKHTPGPWEIGSYADWQISNYYVAQPYYSASMYDRQHGRTICELAYSPYEKGSDPDKAHREVAYANACLIAAAPDLLEALIECERAMTLGTTCCGGEPEEYSEIRIARAAIAKATGKDLAA